MWLFKAGHIAQITIFNFVHLGKVNHAIKMWIKKNGWWYPCFCKWTTDFEEYKQGVLGFSGYNSVMFSLNSFDLIFRNVRNFKAGNQVYTGARISRKFAAIVQESCSFREIRGSPFSVFMFDFRMNRKRAWTFKHDLRLRCKEESMWCKREKLKQLINFVFVKF